MRRGLALLGSFWFGAVMGAAAVLLASLLMGSLNWFLPAAPHNLLYHYQTFITGVLAVIAAFVAVRVTRRQIEQQYELAEDNRIRHNAAARIALPLALDELCVYAQDCTRVLKGLHRYKSQADTLYGNDDNPSVTVPTERLNGFPKIPPTLMTILSNCVETSDAEVSSKIWELSSHLQMQNGRVRVLFARARGKSSGVAVLAKHELETYILDAVDIYARSISLFKFARGKSQRYPIFVSQRDMVSALMACRIYDQHFPDLWKKAEKKYPPPDPREEEDVITIELSSDTS